MADETLKVREPSSGRLLDVEELVVNTLTVLRERMQIVGSGAAEVARVKNIQPAATDYGLVTRELPRRITSQSVNSRISVGTSEVTLLPQSSDRLRAVIQNVGTTLLKIQYHLAAATQTAYVIALAGGASNDDGTGSILIDDGFTGRITAISDVAGGIAQVTELR